MDGTKDSRVGGRSVWTVTLVTSILGFALGLLHATPHLAVERAVALTAVSYPPDNPVWMAMVSGYCLLVDGLAGLLKVGLPPLSASLLTSGLLGAVSFAGIALFILAISESVAVSLAGTVLIYVGHLVGKGVVYPIHLLGFFATEGVLGLSYCLLVLAVFALGRYRAAFLFLGLAPGVHPALGCWMLLVFGVTALLHWHFSWALLRRHAAWFATGAAIAVAGFAVHAWLMRGLPRMDAEMRALFDGYIRFWDAHRGPFFWDYVRRTPSYTAKGVWVCVCSIVLAAGGRALFARRADLAPLFTFVAVSGLLALAAGTLAQLLPDRLPVSVVILMPGRFVNLNNLLFVPLLLGVLLSPVLRSRPAVPLLVLVLALSLFLPPNSAFLTRMWFPVILAWVVWQAVRSRGGAALAGEDPAERRSPAAVQATALMVAVMAIHTLASPDEYDPRPQFARIRREFRDQTNDEFYRAIAARKGLLLTVRDFGLLTLRTGRPLLVDPSIFDHLGCTPQSAKRVNRILNRIYAADLREPAPRAVDPHGSIPPAMHRELWEARTTAEWQDIRREFGVTDVLTTTNFVLQLPVVLRDDRGTLYEIPLASE